MAKGNTSDLLQQLRQKVMAENLAKESAGETRKLVDALELVPQKKMLNDAQYLLNDLLPRIVQKHGDKSEEYKFFRGLVDTIMWSLFIMGRYENMLQKLQHIQLLAEIYKSRMELAERELLNYTTVEDLTLADTLKDIQASVLKRGEQWVNDLTEKK